jgi:hypothetical protein
MEQRSRASPMTQTQVSVAADVFPRTLSLATVNAQGDWATKYLGIPWASGADTPSGNGNDNCLSCLGLRNLVYKEELGAVLPSHYEELLAYQAGFDPRPFREIRDPEDIRPFDTVAFMVRGIESHVGVMVDKKHMLHNSKDVDACIERVDRDPWKSLSPRFYRYSPNTQKDVVCRDVRVIGPYVVPSHTYVSIVAIPERTTIRGAIDLAFPHISERMLSRIQVNIGKDVVSACYWGSVRPKAWDIVVIRVKPDAGFSWFGIVLMLVVAVAAAAVTGGVLAPLVGGGWLAAGSVSAGIAGALVGLAGGLLVNALIATKDPIAPTKTYAISGFQNTLNANGPVPSLLGQMRWAPPLGVLPFNQVIGAERYAIAILLIGYGPVAFTIDDVNLGNTPITRYYGLTYEIRNGYDSDGPLTIQSQQILEDGDNVIDLRYDSTHPVITGDDGIPTVQLVPTGRFTAQATEIAEVELFYPGGLITISKDGDIQTATQTLTIAYRKTGTSTWVTFPVTITGNNAKAFWRTFTYTLPSVGQYEFQLTKNNLDHDSVKAGRSTSEKVQWTCLRSFRNSYPLNYKKPMALLAIRAKSSSQLSGALSAISVMTRRICKDWDATTTSWITRATSNPASLYRYVLQGPENAYPRLDAEIDLGDIADWANYCNNTGLYYNNVHQASESQDTVLDDVAAAGRALKHDRGDLMSVIIDRARTDFKALLTPANTSGFQFTNPKVTFPDAFLVDFMDETFNFAPAQRVVPWPTHVGEVVTTQALSLVGKTSPAEVWKEARRRQYEASLRQNGYTCTIDMEHMTCTRGDAVLLSHFVMNSRQMGGYVRIVEGLTGLIRIDNLVTMEAGRTYQMRCRHLDGTTTVYALLNDPGETSTVRLASPTAAALPIVGDLVAIGEVSTVTRELIIKGIEVGDNFSATLTLVDSAPTLDALAAAETPPAWDGVVHKNVTLTYIAPKTPYISLIQSGSAIAAYETSSNLHPVAVTVMPFPGDAVIPQSMQVQHRIYGTSVWTVEAPSLLPPGVDILSGYSAGDILDIQGRTINNGVVSPWTITNNYTVLLDDTPATAGTISQELTTGGFTADLGSTDIGDPVGIQEDLGLTASPVYYTTDLGTAP